MDAPKPPAKSRPTVLVVDDEEENVGLVKRILRKDFNVVTAQTGQQGLELLQNTSDVALIITDQRMPGMTGAEMLRHSLALAPDAVRIVLSGYSDVTDILDAINLGHVSRFLLKPI